MATRTGRTDFEATSKPQFVDNKLSESWDSHSKTFFYLTSVRRKSLPVRAGDQPFLVYEIDTKRWVYWDLYRWAAFLFEDADTGAGPGGIEAVDVSYDDALEIVPPPFGATDLQAVLDKMKHGLPLRETELTMTAVQPAGTVFNLLGAGPGYIFSGVPGFLGTAPSSINDPRVQVYRNGVLLRKSDLTYVTSTSLSISMLLRPSESLTIES